MFRSKNKDSSKKKSTFFLQRSKSASQVSKKRDELQVIESSFSTAPTTKFERTKGTTKPNRDRDRDRSFFFILRKKRNSTRLIDAVNDEPHRLFLRYEGIAALIERLELMKAHEIEGVFRVTGNLAVIGSLMRELAQDPLPILPQGPEYGVNEYAGALKSYLRESVQPIVPFSHLSAFTNALKTPELLLKLFALSEAVAGLADENRLMLRDLAFFLRKVVKNSDKTLMSINNLAVSFGPSVLRAKESTDLQIVGTSCELLSLLVSYASEVFGSDTPTSPVGGPRQRGPAYSHVRLSKKSSSTGESEIEVTPTSQTANPGSARSVNRRSLEHNAKSVIISPTTSIIEHHPPLPPPRLPLLATKYGAFISTRNANVQPQIEMISG